jgi:hypothetical protein
MGKRKLAKRTRERDEKDKVNGDRTEKKQQDDSRPP